MVRIGNDLLDNFIAALRVRVGEPHRGSTRIDIFENPFQITLFFVDEGFAIREQELHIPGLRAVNGGIVDFVQNAMRDGVPDAAGSRVRHANRVFSRRGPARLCPGCSEGSALTLNPAVAGSLVRHRLEFPPKWLRLPDGWMHAKLQRTSNKPGSTTNQRTWVLASGSGWKATSRMAWVISRFFIKHSHTKPLRRFSAISIPIPTSIPITSSPYQPAFGWKASANP